MVWVRTARYEKYGGDQFISGLFSFATGEDAHGVTVKQQRQQHMGGDGGLPPPSYACSIGLPQNEPDCSHPTSLRSFRVR